MDLNLNEEQQMIQDAARRFAESELAPVAEKKWTRAKIGISCWGIVVS